MIVSVYITLKQGVLDPQGKAIHAALGHLGFSDIREIRQGKWIEIELEHEDRHRAQADVKKMCEVLLANTVIENYHIELP